MADAARLSLMLQDAVFSEADRMESDVEASVGVVRARDRREGGGSPALRWGVHVRLKHSR